ncbi:amidase [Burkholderia cenocepacia]|uniref:amidase n=1 Tax=Burkholderia cenocepacia TaxID=95486 RepID=UPI002AB1CA94|nr:amidase [Burkholderia cenocepacia]
MANQLHTPISDAPELCRISAHELVRRYSTGEISPVEVAHQCLERAEQINPALRAFTLIEHGEAMNAARLSETRWRNRCPLSPIDGVPTTIKDIVEVAGWATHYGSNAVETKPAAEDCRAVRQLRRAGAVFLGLTSTPEFGWKAVTDSPRSGSTVNPWNQALTAGGSSGGAAVAASVGAGALHLGTDGGGSIRIPAAFTGVVGFKPTFGRVPAYPASAFGTLAHLGPITRSVEDARMMLSAMSAVDSRDWYQVSTLPALDRQDPLDLKGKRIGYWNTPACGAIDPRIAACVDAAIGRLADAGAEVEEVTLPAMALRTIFSVLWSAGAASRRSNLPEKRRRDLDPGFVELADGGARLTAMEYVAASAARAEFGVWMERLFERVDLLVSAATAIPAFEAGAEAPRDHPETSWFDWAGFNFPLNLSQQPACVVPCGITSGRQPIGVQVAGARGRDADVLAAALAVEQVVTIDWMAAEF